MTALATSKGRRAARTTVALGTASLGLLALSGCQKPSPSAHFTLGSHTASRETAEECHGHDEPLGVDRVRECLDGEDGVPAFTAGVGSTFRIGVDPEVADTGWLVFYNGLLHDATPFTSTYQTFEVDRLRQSQQQQNQTTGALPERGDLRVVVAQVSEDYDAEAIWNSESQEQYEERLFGSFEGVWNVDLESDV
ncbi:hypothetical protein [Streptomyces sp. MP131-18]|uniref:hypothetical protein n=1 Tax=Streptomyces sp. MP131-18 TaxID=1857892 RepID=UPI00097C1C96|nr:hypothetical protein [Streptomyces sp. MP131-18]ONK13585.1 hypothetical protein STBA_43550 [Streptomyces sp. MP131-18]